MLPQNFDIEDAKGLLKFIKRIVKVLDILRCSEDIDANDMSETDWRNVYWLIVAFINKEPVRGLKMKICALYHV